MRSAAFTALWALLSFLMTFNSVMIIHVHEGRVPFLAGFWLAALLLLGAGMPCLTGFLDRPQGERRRARKSSFLWGLMPVSLGMAVAGLPLTGVLVLYRGQWALIMPVLVGLALCVLTVVLLYRERNWADPPLPEPTPKLVGLLAGTPLPEGWIPVHVSRPSSQFPLVSTDYRVFMDGAPVGAVGRGETLLVGLTAGPHVVRGWIHGVSSPPLHLTLNAGETVHLVLEPDGTVLSTPLKMIDRGRYLRLTRRDRLWSGPGTGVQGANQ